MNYSVIVPLARFEIAMTQWLLANVSPQAVLWKVEIDLFERRIIFFKDKEKADAFRVVFKL